MTGISVPCGLPNKKMRLSLKSRKKSFANHNTGIEEQTSPLITKFIGNESNSDRPSPIHSEIGDSNGCKNVNLQSCLTENTLPIATLINLGNTCFLNSVLYVLRFTPGFVSSLHGLYSQIICLQKKMKEERCHPTWDFVIQLQKVFLSLHELECAALKPGFSEEISVDIRFQPYELIKSLRNLNPLFEDTAQHDAHELLSCILNSLREANQLVFMKSKLIQEKQNRPQLRSSKKFGFNERGSEAFEDTKNTADMISGLYEGTMVLRTRCFECENITEVAESFLDIPISILTETSSAFKDDIDDNDKQQEWHMFQEVLTGTEILEGDNKYWCDLCLHHNEAKRLTHFHQLPPVLILQLKRFSSSRYSTGTSKLTDYMPTPEVLECLLESCHQPCANNYHRYNLFAIIMHTGVSLLSGHYTAIVKIHPGLGSNTKNCLFNTVSKLNNNSQADISKENLSKIDSLNCNGQSKNQVKQSVIEKKTSELKTEEPLRNCCCKQEYMKIRVQFDNLSNANQSSWLYCDDEIVSELSDEDIKQMLSPITIKNAAITPYLLFYSKKDFLL